MEIAASSQYSPQSIAPNSSRQRTVAQPIPRPYHGTDLAQYLNAQGDRYYTGPSPSAVEPYFEGFDASHFPQGNNVGSILKQAVSFVPQVRENPFEKLRQGAPFRDFSASFPQDEQEAATRYAAAQSSGKTFEDIEDGVKRKIAGDIAALDKTLTSWPGEKPADMRTTTAQGTIVTLLTPPVGYSESTPENFSLQVTRKDGFQLTLPLDGDVRMNEREDGSISLYYPASGKRLTYDAEGNKLEEMLGAGEQGTDGDDILINVSGSRVDSGSGNDTIFNLTNDVSITGEEGNKSIFMGGASRKNVSIELGDGNYRIYASMLEDSNIDLGNGNNTIAMDIVHNSNIKAGNGDNALLVSRARGISMSIGDGNNTITSQDIYGGSTVQAGDGNNIVNVPMVSESALNVGSGNNTIQTSTVYHGSINMGNGNNTYTSDLLLTAYVATGGGKNTVNCNTAVSSQFFIGNDSHTASKGSLFSHAQGATQDAGSIINIKKLSGSALHTGSGNDYVTVDNKDGSTINTGAGDDGVCLGKQTWDIAEGVDLGAGRDTVFVKSKWTGQYEDMTHLFK